LGYVKKSSHRKTNTGLGFVTQQPTVCEALGPILSTAKKRKTNVACFYVHKVFRLTKAIEMWHGGDI
jgi:hypothetical protein